MVVSLIVHRPNAKAALSPKIGTVTSITMKLTDIAIIHQHAIVNPIPTALISEIVALIAVLLRPAKINTILAIAKIAVFTNSMMFPFEMSKSLAGWPANLALG
jgi:hypothetical protein